jgi:hypothetical protein
LILIEIDLFGHFVSLYFLRQAFTE